MREWVWVARHLKSAPSFEEWLTWPRYRQRLLRQELNRAVQESNIHTVIEDSI
jgi:hypothetical protein